MTIDQRLTWLVVLAFIALPQQAQTAEQAKRRSGGYLASSRPARGLPPVNANWRHGWQQTPKQPSSAPASSTSSSPPSKEPRAAPVVHLAQAREPLFPGPAATEVIPSPRRPSSATLQFQTDDAAES